MHTEKIKVVLDRNRSVNVEATVSHSYISTGDPGSGSPNVTHYDIVCMGIECEGTWCDDARYPTTVHDCPDELRAALEPVYKAQQEQRNQREIARLRVKMRTRGLSDHARADLRDDIDRLMGVRA